MKKCLVLFLVLISHVAMASGDAAAGKIKSKACAACHAGDGNSLVGIWPKLAGQHEKYLIQQLADFKMGEKGGRYNAVMYPLVKQLSEQDMADLAAYYSSRQVKLGEVKAELLARGQSLYRGGDLNKKITACIACHGPRGLGNADAGFPALSGQHAEYTVSQLQGFQNKTRTNGINHIMQDVAMRMSQDDMQAVASYIEGLH